MSTPRCGYKPERNLGSLKVVGAHATIASTNAYMTNFKTLIAVALVSTFAVASFAQAPATPKDAAMAVPAAVTTPADATAKPAAPVKKHVVKKHAAKKVEKVAATPKAEAAAPAVSAAK